MRATIAISTLVAFVTSSVSAAPAARAATDCNPTYDVAPSTTCFTNCNTVAGQVFVPGWTMDSASPLFIASLEIMCDKTSANYRTFMTNAGTCMAQCTGDDPELFNAEFRDACAWWAIHKDDTC